MHTNLSSEFQYNQFGIRRSLTRKKFSHHRTNHDGSCINIFLSMIRTWYLIIAQKGWEFTGSQVLKRILLFSDLSWSNWKEFSVSILVNPSHFWSIMFQTHTSGQSFTLLVNPSHFWSITSGRFFPCHACNFWSILHTSNQSVTLLPVMSGQSLTLLGSILHRSIQIKMQSESSTVYWRSKRSHGINLELAAHERLILGTQERRTDTTLINQKVEIYGHSLIIAKRSRGEFNATSMNW